MILFTKLNAITLYTFRQVIVLDLVYKVIVFNLLNKITYKMFFVTEAKYRLILQSDSIQFAK